MKTVTFIKGIFSTIRFPNLIIICLSLYLVRYTIVKPILEDLGVYSGITDQAYMLLVSAILCIAAGGYVINDYYDTDIDAINKPGKNKTGTVISRNASISLYVSLTLSALALIWYFGKLQNIQNPLLVIFLSSGLLYFYSSAYKKMLLVGNLVISALTALTIGLSILFDPIALSSEPVKLLVIAYAIFAFLLTFIREIIKDCEDASGDAAFGANTLPVVAGIKSARMIAALLATIVLGAIIYIQVNQMQWQNKISFVYTIFLIQSPLIRLITGNLFAKTIEQDKKNSNIAKLIMVTGLLSMLVFGLSSN